MKKISEHLGEIIIALAGVALLIAAIVVFKAPIGDFYHSITSRETAVGTELLSGMEGVNLSDLSSDPSGGGYNHDDPALHPNNGTTPVDGEKYYDGDYVYTYSATLDGWRVDINGSVKDRNQASYGAILESINGEPITYLGYTFRFCANLLVSPVIPQGVTKMVYTFQGCTNLTAPPEIPQNTTDLEGAFSSCNAFVDLSDFVIPSNVTNMYNTFSNCNSLSIAPEIPNSVTNMSNTFYCCTSLTVAPTIPDSVTNMGSTFWNCCSLTGAITINCTPTQWTQCLYFSKVTEINGDTTIANNLLLTKTSSATNPTA